MHDTDTIEAIESRIKSLEDLVYGNSAPDSENKCVETLMNVQNKLQSAVTGREKITTVFSKLDDLEKYLNPDFKENVTLTDPVKTNLVLLEEDRIRNAVDSLQTVKELMQYLDSEHIKVVPSLCPKLYEVSQIQIKLQEHAGELTKETKQLIANYDDLVLSLSKQFILWDSILSKIEKEKLPKKKILT
ncbi:dynactin subunit 3 [Parasteatoda tepidariorum]|uniref:dynactin subunit 3 n=1 Tax=Parasteatoda tepidariorum TaxID=114398 RepID=UPI00077FD08E|nr:dynactin subunit 3 [Parasteatoda tepidariorum]